MNKLYLCEAGDAIPFLSGGKKKDGFSRSPITGDLKIPFISSMGAMENL
jgi:hypothetical protein